VWRLLVLLSCVAYVAASRGRWLVTLVSRLRRGLQPSRSTISGTIGTLVDWNSMLAYVRGWCIKGGVHGVFAGGTGECSADAQDTLLMMIHLRLLMLTPSAVLFGTFFWCWLVQSAHFYASHIVC
jgi:hypothetical protein